MKTRYVIAITALGAAFAMPVAAHHNCNGSDEVCPEEIGDMQGNHEDAISGIPDNMGGGVPDNTAAMDPADAERGGRGEVGGVSPTQSGPRR